MSIKKNSLIITLAFVFTALILLAFKGNSSDKAEENRIAASSGDVIEVSNEKSNVDSKGFQTERLEQSRRTAIVNAIEKASPAVVSITVTRARNLRRNPFFDDPFFDLFLGQGRGRSRESVSSIGSGVIVNSQGYIVTNYHVMELNRGEAVVEIKVNLPDGRSFNGKIVGQDPDNDLAVIKIKGSKLPYARFQKNQDNLIGEWVVAIGNPFGFLMGDNQPTVTVGVISALNRNFSHSSGIGYHNMIQTDASINPGNSGGALVNVQGDVIGINTFIITGQQGGRSGSVGMGFAIPIQKAMRVVNELVKYGYIRQWTTGIYTNPYYSEYENALGGILVTDVERGSPGQKAGLQKGDVIFSVEDHPTSNIKDFLEILRKFQVGESVKIGYIRGKQKLYTKMVLEENKQ